MPILSIPTGGTGVTIDPIIAVPILDTFTVSESGSGWAKLVADGGNGDLLKRLLQGLFVVDATGASVQNPSTFGGLTPNNTADEYTTPTYGQYVVTTTMPNSNAPAVNYIVCPGAFIAEVLQVIDDNTMIVKDTSGYIASVANLASIYGLSTNSYPLRSGQVVTTSSSTCTIFTASQAPLEIGTNQTIDFLPNNYEEIEPFMVTCRSGTITMIYNE